MKNTSLNMQTVRDFLTAAERHISRYRVALFLLLLALVYGFVLYRISALSGVQPTDGQITSQVKTAATPRVDPSIVKQMQALQDNSVNVHALFDKARSNPFHE